jgi:hypothetical protein
MEKLQLYKIEITSSLDGIPRTEIMASLKGYNLETYLKNDIDIIKNYGGVTLHDDETITAITPIKKILVFAHDGNEFDEINNILHQ